MFAAAPATTRAQVRNLASSEVALAEQYHRQACELSRAIGSSVDEADALAGLGRCALAARRPADAEALLGQALEIFQRIGAAAASGVRAELAALASPRPAGTEGECRAAGAERVRDGSGSWPGRYA